MTGVFLFRWIKKEIVHYYIDDIEEMEKDRISISDINDIKLLDIDNNFLKNVFIEYPNLNDIVLDKIV